MAGRYVLMLALCLLCVLTFTAGAAADGRIIDPALPDSPALWELDTGKDGPVVLVIAGIHGDEVSGIRAAEQLEGLPLSCGKLCWIPAANTYGAEQNRRKARDDRDLNRNFLGDPGGNSTRQIAACITRQIQEIRPDLILDLHEATAWDDGWDNLGSSVIFADLDPVADLIFEMMDLEPAPNFFSSPPAGSVNAYFTQEYGIPVLTLEAARGEPLETRISFHLQMIRFILEFYHML